MNKYTRYEVSGFLKKHFYSATISRINKLVRDIINVSKFINEKYPELDITSKIIDNLLKYIPFNNTVCLAYIEYLGFFVEKLSKFKYYDQDKVLNLITNDKYVFVLFMYLYSEGYIRNISHINTKDFLYKLPRISNSIVDNISLDLYPEEILFLLELISDKDMNMKISEEINKENYVNIIERILGNSKTEIGLFHIINQYFNLFPNFEWYKLYKIMIKYKNRTNIIDYFSENIKAIVDYSYESNLVEKDKHVNYFFNEYFQLLKTREGMNALTLYINNNISLLLLLYFNHYNKNFTYFIKNVIPKGFKISNKESGYIRNVYYIRAIIDGLEDIYKSNEKFMKKLATKVFTADQNRMFIFSKLVDAYDSLFDNFISKDYYSNSELNDFLISLLDKDDKEILSYIDLFEKLYRIITKAEVDSYHKEHSLVFKIKGRVIDFCNNSDKETPSIGIKKVLTYILMFLINKNDVIKSTDFICKFENILNHVANNNIIVNEKLIEFIYSSSEKEIEGIAKI